MKRVRTQLDLPASAEDAWAVLSDLSGWSGWNPVIPKIEGDGRVGGTVAFDIVVEPGRPMKLNAKFSEWEAPRAIAWGAGIPGVFGGEHFLRLEPRGDGRCRILHGEDFRGLVPTLLFGAKRIRSIEEAYARMNEALAKELERVAAR